MLQLISCQVGSGKGICNCLPSLSLAGDWLVRSSGEQPWHLDCPPGHRGLSTGDGDGYAVGYSDGGVESGHRLPRHWLHLQLDSLPRQPLLRAPSNRLQWSAGMAELQIPLKFASFEGSSWESRYTDL